LMCRKKTILLFTDSDKLLRVLREMNKRIESGTFFLGVLLSFTLKITLDSILGRPLVGYTEYILFIIVYALLINILIGTGTRQINTLLEQWIPWQQATRKRLIIQTFLAGLLAFVVVSIFALITYLLILPYPDPVNVMKRGITVGTLHAMTLGILYTAGYFFEQWGKSYIEAERLKHENLLSQFSVLKQQVNPHFLFNALSTLSSLLVEDQKRATEFVQKLSIVYRYVLESKEKDIIDLADEIEAAQAYAYLQQTRFGENLKVSMCLPGNYRDKLIAPLTLQILLENAIKHNIVSSKRPLLVEVKVEDDSWLIVKNNLQKKTSIEAGTQIGLKNIVNRYQFLDNRTVDISETDSEFTVRIPLLQKAAV
jgi:two-component system, LytTR family, sensor kinase